MRSCVGAVCECLIRNEERLNELDRGSGDGDCGTTLKAGCSGIRNSLSVLSIFSSKKNNLMYCVVYD